MAHIQIKITTIDKSKEFIEKEIIDFFRWKFYKVRVRFDNEKNLPKIFDNNAWLESLEKLKKGAPDGGKLN